MRMNENLYSKELKRNKRNLVIWSAIVIGLTILVMSVFPYMKNMGEELAKIMKYAATAMITTIAGLARLMAVIRFQRRNNILQ